MSVRNLRKSFGGHVVLDGLDLDLYEGEMVLLRGDNGSGKTTLQNILAGNLEPDEGTIHLRTNGHEEIFQFPRKWWDDINPFDRFTPERVAAEGVGRTWQDVRLFATLSLCDNIAVAQPRQIGENPLRALVGGSCSAAESANRQAGATLLASLNLAGREQSSGDKISLGQSKRVAIARAVQAGARILFLDEPLSGLDAAGIAEVLGLLSSLARKERLTIVIVEHVFNYPHLRDLVTTDWLLEQGKISSGVAGTTVKMFSAEHSDRPWMKLFTDTGSTVIDEPLPHGAILTRIRRTDRAGARHDPILQIRNLIVERGSRVVIGLNDERQEMGLSFQIFNDEIAVLQAPNGWGKSTLLAAIAGLIPTTTGKILLSDHLLDRLPVWQRIRSGLRLVPSDHNIFPHFTAKDTFRLAGKPDSAAIFGAASERPTSALSGGQKQRLVLLAEQGQPMAQLCMFDEPFANLDALAIAEAACNILSQKAKAVLIALPATNN